MGFRAIDMRDRMSIIKETGINSISLSRYAAITSLGAFISFMIAKNRKEQLIYIGILAVGLFMLLLA